MNNTQEAEKIKDDQVLILKLERYSHEEVKLINGNGDTFTYNPQTRNGEELEDFLTGAYSVESYINERINKILSSLTDEVIEGIVYNHCDGTWRKPDGVEVADEVDVKAVVKAIRNHLTQKK